MDGKRPPHRNAFARWQIALADRIALNLSADVWAAAKVGLTIRDLLKTGWQIAG